MLWGDNEIIESDPPRKLVHGWRALYDEAQPGGFCRLTVVDDRLEDSPRTATSVSGGWMFIISGLKTLLETGEPLAERSLGAPQSRMR